MYLTVEILKKWYKAHYEEIQRDFFKFLSFPSISADPKYAKDVRQTAQWLCDYLGKMDLDASIWETSGHPVVFASNLKAGTNRPTILIYQHYDVQPVDPLELWKSDPFTPTIRDNKVYARGAVDNKGQCFYSISAIRAFLELSKQLNINLKLFIEGEEESGGKGTTGILEKKKKDLKADHLLIVDFDIPAAGSPAITLGMRGIVTMNVIFRCANTDLHSGMHGGIILNPNRALASAISKLWDEKGKVAIPGFYDDVKPVSAAEKAKLDFTFDKEHYIKAFGAKALSMEEGCLPLESNWLRPSLEINGMGGGYTGEGFKTVIPAKAQAKISCRLVPDQNPEKVGKAIGDFLRRVAPSGVEITTEILHGAPAFRAPIDSEISQVAAGAFTEVFEKPCRFMLCGASVPIVPDLASASSAEVALIGVGLGEDDIHAPNEHFGLDRFEQGFLIIGRILEQLNKV